MKKTMAIYCDCNSRGGVWSYTLRTLNMFKHWGWSTLLVTHPSRNEQEKPILQELINSADQHVYVDDALSSDENIAVIVEALTRNAVDVFIPNYRKISYAAAALQTRRRTIDVIGVCHADHVSYYTVLRRYQDVISLFVCPSSKTKNELTKHVNVRNREKIRQIPHYVSLRSKDKAAYADTPFTVIYHGRIREEQKHCSEIIRVAEIVTRQNRHVRFLLMGDGSETEHFQRSITDKSLSSNVAILPSRSWPEVQDALLASQLAILTSRFEGFCYGVAEALSAGLPVAAYNCGSVINDFVESGKNGFIADWGNAGELAEWISRVARNPGMWNEYADAATRTADATFSFEKVQSQYQRALQATQGSATPWPYLRPAYIPVRGKSLRSFWERTGARLSLWDP